MRIDRLLPGVGERLDAVGQGLGPAARHAVREGAAAGLAHGFATVMLWLGVLTLAGTVLWALLLRRPPRLTGRYAGGSRLSGSCRPPAGPRSGRRASPSPG